MVSRLQKIKGSSPFSLWVLAVVVIFNEGIRLQRASSFGRVPLPLQSSPASKGRLGIVSFDKKNRICSRRCKWDTYLSEANFMTADNEQEAAQESESYPRVSIEYCTGCKWMLRAAWLSQELLTTFQDDLHSVTLVPSRPPAPAGIFQIKLLDDNTVLWDRKEEGRFPEAKEIKQRLRDIIKPEKSLGHSDTKSRQEQEKEKGGSELKKSEVTDQGGVTVSSVSVTKTRVLTLDASDDKCDECIEERRETVQAMQSHFEDMDDEDAEELRRKFGVW